MYTYNVMIVSFVLKSIILYNTGVRSRELGGGGAVATPFLSRKVGVRIVPPKPIVLLLILLGFAMEFFR